MKKSYVWLNGNFIIEDDACNYEFSKGISEKIRVYKSKIFKLEDHIKNLFLSAKTLMMKHYFSVENIKSMCLELVELNKIKDGSIHLCIFLDDFEVNFKAICTHRLTTYHPKLSSKKKLNLTLSSPIKPIPYLAQAIGIYIPNYLAKKHSIANGFDDALIVDHNQYISMATTSNVFAIKNNHLYTPKTDYCHNSITRQVIFELAKNNHLSITEKNIAKDEILSADEVFLANSYHEISAVSSIQNKQYYSNPITELLYAKYYQLTQELDS